jgi:Ca-activated chloride channel family protein
VPDATAPPPALNAPAPGAAPLKVTDFLEKGAGKDGGLAERRNEQTERQFGQARPGSEGKPGDSKDGDKSLEEARQKKELFDEVRRALARGDRAGIQAGRTGVDLAEQMNKLRNQNRLERKALRNVAGRNCIEVGGIWIDEGFDPKQPTVTVKAMSDAYFRILERQPKAKEVFQLGNYLVWVTPSGANLVIDVNDGKETLSDKEIDALFAPKR